MHAPRRSRPVSSPQTKADSASGSRSVGGADSNWATLQRTIGNQAVLQMVGGRGGKTEKRKNLKETAVVSRKEKNAAALKAAQKRRKNAKNDELNVRRGRYAPGMHGYKKSEQKRLSEEHDIKVTGESHESEHTIGFEPLNQTSGNKRGSNSTARSLENRAPAYQEVKGLQRKRPKDSRNPTL